MPPELEAPVQPPLALRVSFLGERARSWLSAWVQELPLAALEEDDPAARPHALVVDAGADGAERLAGSARERGTPVITLPGDGPSASDNGAAPQLRIRPVDPRVVNPLGFRGTDVAGFAAISDGDPNRIVPALDLLREVAREEPVALYTPRDAGVGELPDGVLRTTPSPDGEEAVLAELRAHLGVVDQPSLHRADRERATALVRLCAAGIPVAAAGLTPELRALLGPELSEALDAVSWHDLVDLDRREQVSVAQRRAALRNHSLDARWRSLARAAGIDLPARPKVSAILSTRRQSWLDHGIEQFKRQNYEPRELIVCLHGDDFSPHVEEDLRRAVSHPLEILHVRGDLTLGDALNQGVEVATGDLISKMDDDDYYSVDHLWDLVLAAEYSGADLVGKAAEFVYLEEIDVTIRQLSRDVETRLAGGGMMMRRGPLVELGGWPSLSRAEDLALVRRYDENGRRIHRTQPHGYILNRHGRDHTWRPYVDYFLFRSGRQWRGLRFDQTGII